MRYDLTLHGICGFDEKMAFCDAPDHCHTFRSAPIVKYTQNGPLPEGRRSVSTSLENSHIPLGFSDLSAECGSTWSALTGSKMSARSEAGCAYRGWNMNPGCGANEYAWVMLSNSDELFF